MIPNQIIKTTCPYCGVGCGIEATVDQDRRQLTIRGDIDHPANWGRLCSKGTALGDTIELKSRLLEPRIFGRETSWTEALDLVANTFNNIIKQHGVNAVAIYGSGQLLTEDYYVANKFMKGFIGSANIDTNSRLCMSSSVAGHKRAFGSDTVPGCYADLELAELIILIGSNAAWCHPVIFQRIRAAKEQRPTLKIVVIDPRQTASCDIADLHLPLASGTDAVLFNGLLHFMNDNQAIDAKFIQQHTEGFAKAIACAHISIDQVAITCGLDPRSLLTFYQWFVDYSHTVSLYSQGINQSSSGTDKVNAILNCHLATGRIGKPGMGPFSLTGQPNAMGGREVGGLSHQLAAHMDFANTDDLNRVAQFWGTDRLASAPGYSATELFDAIDAGKVKSVWIMGTNPVVSLPNADKVRHALQQCELVVVSDCIAQTDTTALAHVLLPTAGWSEKDGTVTNSERRISRQRALFKPAGHAQPDWWIITQVAQRMGFAHAFPYQQPAEIFREHAALSGYDNREQRDFDLSELASLTDEEYQQLQPIQWPINKAHPKGRARFFEDGRFFTPSGKAQFIPIIPRPPVNIPDSTYPLVLNTGRIRDQWHTMTRTALAAHLNQHKPEPFVEIHSSDRHYLCSSTDTLPNLALIESQWGSMIARVQVTDNQQPGNLFVPMHWNEQYSNRGRMGALVNPVIDPISKQPESKHTPVRISAYRPRWQGFILSRQELSIGKPEYWVKIRAQQHFRYELAGSTPATDWRQWRTEQMELSESESWIEYQDTALGNYRAALITEQQLQCVVFISSEIDNINKQPLPDRIWLSSLFELAQLEPSQRTALLTGLPPLGKPDTGPLVCACFQVGEYSIRAAIKEQQLKTHQDVGRCLQAGSNCGSCIPEIKILLETAWS